VMIERQEFEGHGRERTRYTKPRAREWTESFFVTGDKKKSMFRDVL
jgi:hypothetical protein